MKFNKQQWSWILYDPACSAHALIVRTLFAAIFLEVCVDGQFEASKITSMWASTASFACLFAGAIAVLSGPWVDAKKYKVPALIISSAICILSCFAYLFCHQGDWIAVLAISFAGIASFAVAERSRARRKRSIPSIPSSVSGSKREPSASLPIISPFSL